MGCRMVVDAEKKVGEEEGGEQSFGVGELGFVVPSEISGGKPPLGSFRRGENFNLGLLEIILIRGSQNYT